MFNAVTVHPNKRLASVSAVVGSPFYVGKIAIARERELNPPRTDLRVDFIATEFCTG